MILPDIESLRCFVAAAQTLNFRAASRAVHLTPAALGQRIKQLEDQLDTPLFTRTTRSVALTAAGLALLPVAKQTLELAQECHRAVRGDIELLPTELVLGTRHELGLSWVLPQLEPLREKFPHVTFHLYFGSGEDLLLRLRTREVDIAVTSTRLNDPRLDAVKLHPEEYIFVGAKALLKRTPLTRPEHAEKHTLIDVRSDLPLFRYWRDAPGAGDHLRFARVLHLGTIRAIEQFVLQERGVAVLPHYLVRDALAAGTLKQIFPNTTSLTDHFRLVFRQDDPRRPLFQAIGMAMLETPLQ
ncbi:MAG: LysR family transcriptional regulator [Deltaproteobacteria bacterium]|nr:LysR family transcriptional regulator [Deltaproteobacteria bacterium]